MNNINWTEFKIFKKTTAMPGENNLLILINFCKSFYNQSDVDHLYDMFKQDDLSSSMMKKNDIKSPSDLHDFLYKNR